MYSIVLGFAEAYRGNCMEEKHVLSAAVNGVEFVEDLDVYATVGCGTALIIEKPMKLVGGESFEIVFTASVENPMVSLIDIKDLACEESAATDAPTPMPSVSPDISTPATTDSPTVADPATDSSAPTVPTDAPSSTTNPTNAAFSDAPATMTTDIPVAAPTDAPTTAGPVKITSADPPTVLPTVFPTNAPFNTEPISDPATAAPANPWVEGPSRSPSGPAMNRFPCPCFNSTTLNGRNYNIAITDGAISIRQRALMDRSNYPNTLSWSLYISFNNAKVYTGLGIVESNGFYCNKVGYDGNIRISPQEFNTCKSMILPHVENVFRENKISLGSASETPCRCSGPAERCSQAFEPEPGTDIPKYKYIKDRNIRNNTSCVADYSNQSRIILDENESNACQAVQIDTCLSRLSTWFTTDAPTPILTNAPVQAPIEPGTCYPGFEKDANGTCVDIDECKTSSPCVQNEVCQNKEGSYKCECRYGFFRSSLGTCVVTCSSPGNLCLPSDTCVDQDVVDDKDTRGFRCDPKNPEESTLNRCGDRFCAQSDVCSNGRCECEEGMVRYYPWAPCQQPCPYPKQTGYLWCIDDSRYCENSGCGCGEDHVRSPVTGLCVTKCRYKYIRYNLLRCSGCVEDSVFGHRCERTD